MKTNKIILLAAALSFHWSFSQFAKIIDQDGYVNMVNPTELAGMPLFLKLKKANTKGGHSSCLFEKAINKN